MAAAPDPSAELMELREAEAFGIVENHDTGVRNIHSHLDDGCGNQRSDFSLSETPHHLFLFLRPEFAMDQPDLMRSEAFFPFLKRFGSGLRFERFAFLYQRIDEIGLPSQDELLLHEFRDVSLLRRGPQGGDDFPAARRFFIE